MGIEIEPTGAAAGAEIRGIDLSRPVDDSTFNEIESTFNEHGVVYFRDQRISADQQIAFGRRFGTLDHNYNSEDWGVPGHPELFTISNIVKNGRTIGPRRVGERWHSDMCYAACPPRATMLYAIEVPQLHGLSLGDTEFANAAAAWSALPGAMQQRLSHTQAVFDFRARKRGNAVSDEVSARYPPVHHPVMRSHPSTGRKSLYVMRDDCTGVVDMADDEAQALITALADHIVRPEFVYRHRWREGDVLMWDNCTVQHRAVIDYDLPQRRLMHRLTIAGTAPV